MGAVQVNITAEDKTGCINPASCYPDVYILNTDISEYTLTTVGGQSGFYRFSHSVDVLVGRIPGASATDYIVGFFSRTPFSVTYRVGTSSGTFVSDSYLSAPDTFYAYMEATIASATYAATDPTLVDSGEVANFSSAGSATNAVRDIGYLLFAGHRIGIDPYNPAGSSTSGTYPGEIVDGKPVGGDGTFDFDSDLIPDSSTPTNPFAGGMITGYMLTDAQMQQLAQFLWASPWDWLAQWRKLWGDPMNAIIGCFKINLPAYSGSSATVKLGNIDTGISALAVSGIATVNCGTVFIDKKYGSYLDYSPYTSLELYLPYIGTVGLNVDEVMGKYVTVSYTVCLLDGSATCTVFVGDGTNLSVLHQYSCMVGMDVPITSAQYDGMQRSLSNVIGAVTDNIVPAITTIAGVAAGLLNPAIAAGALGGMASNIMGAEENNPVTLNKPNIRHSGGISMASGLMGRQRPYIIRHTPRMAFPEGQNTYIGYPNWTGISLGSLTGFTRVHKIHLSCSGTEEEKAEIVRLLMEGVIL